MPKVSRRSCAIHNCTNSWYQLEKWMAQTCTLHNCNHGTASCICEPPFKLFPFPTERADLAGKLKLASIVNRKVGTKKWCPSDSRICSVHFIGKQPTKAHPYPTLELGYSPCGSYMDGCNKTVRPPSQRFEIQTLQLQKPTDIQKSKKMKCEVDSSKFGFTTTGTDHNYAEHCEQTIVRENENKILKEKLQKLENEVVYYYRILSCRSQNKKLMNQQFSIRTVLQNDKKCKFYTGIPTVKAFNVIFAVIQDKTDNIHYWKGPRKNCNPLKQKEQKQELISTLMKLRLGLLFQDLADRFNISMTHASNIFTTWVKILTDTLGSIVFNPPMEIVKANIPTAFQIHKKYRNIRHIVDCTEVFLEKPNSLTLAAQTWSDYKQHHTGKFLVSINPFAHHFGSSILYQCSGGRTSDKHITVHSGFLDIVERNDSVMADRGFTIREDLALVGAELFIPPGRRGASQMSRDEVNLTKEIANHKIYIEQAIRCMKTFRILKYEVSLTLVHHLDDIVKIAGGICNMHPPLRKYQ